MESIYHSIEDNISEIIQLCPSFPMIIHITTSSRNCSKLITNSSIILFQHRKNNLYHLNQFDRATCLSIHGNNPQGNNLSNELIQMTNIRKLSLNVKFEDNALNLSSLINLTCLKIHVNSIFSHQIMTSIRKLKRHINCLKGSPDGKSVKYLGVESLNLIFGGSEFVHQAIQINYSNLTKLKVTDVDLHIQPTDRYIFLSFTKECSENIIRMNLNRIELKISSIFISLIYLKLCNIQCSKVNPRKFTNISSMINLQELILYENCEHIYFNNLSRLTYLYVGENSGCEMLNCPINLWNLEVQDNFQIDFEEDMTSLTRLIINRLNDAKHLTDKLMKCNELKYIMMNNNKFENIHDLRQYVEQQICD